MFGLVGIPVTALATHAVTLGVRFVAFHNEQSAGYAASAYGYLAGRPGILLTRPLIVFGKGAAIARAENGLKKLVETTGIPFLPTPMGKGLLPDTHELAATAARSLAIVVERCEVHLSGYKQGGN
ncbi:hypothetical protein C3L33_23467, partial [Rhododendron williamsianum]